MISTSTREKGLVTRAYIMCVIPNNILDGVLQFVRGTDEKNSVFAS